MRNFNKNRFLRGLSHALLLQGLVFISLLGDVGYLVPVLTVHSEPASSSKSRVYKILPGASQVRFNGSSPFDKFTGTTSQAEGFIEGDINAITKEPSTEVKAEVRVDAKSLDTGNEGRDKNMRKTLDVEKYPLITFRLSRASLIEKSSGAGPSKYKVEGTLSIHGVDRPITVEVTSKMEASRITISGKMPLDITDYKIDPPKVPVLFFVRMDKNVTVEFTLVAEAAS